MGWLLVMIAGLCLFPDETKPEQKFQTREGSRGLRVGAIDTALCLELNRRSGVFELAQAVLKQAYPEIDWARPRAAQRRLARGVMLHVQGRLTDRDFIARCRVGGAA